jgi:hypothetical protein
MNNDRRQGFAMLAALVTVTVLLLMWSAAYREVNSAISVEAAGKDRSAHVDGPLLAAADALESLEAGQVPAGSSMYHTSVTTADGTFDYVVTMVSSTQETGGPGPGSSAVAWHITVAPDLEGER